MNRELNSYNKFNRLINFPIMFYIEKNGQNNDDYAFHIDKINPVITGWVLNKRHPINELLIRYPHHEEQKIPLTINRPDVKEKFSVFNVPVVCGFSFTPKVNQHFSLTIKIFDSLIEIAKFFYITDKKIVFLDIVKSPYDQINHFFVAQLGEARCLTNIDYDKNWVDRIEEKAFISGCISIQTLKEKIPYLKKNCYSMLSIAEPVMCLLTYLNWIKQLDFSQNTSLIIPSKLIQNLSLKLKKFNLTKAEEISNLVNSLTPSEFNLLANRQTRLLRKKQNRPVLLSDVDDALSNSHIFDAVCFDDEFDIFFKMIAEELVFVDYLLYEKIPEQPNDALLLFNNNAQILQLLLPLIEYDILLYQGIKNARNNINFDSEKTKFTIVNIDPIVIKSTTPFSGKHLGYHEFLPAAIQKITPVIWLGNTVDVEFNFAESTSNIPAANLYEFQNVYLAGQGCIIDENKQVLSSQHLQMHSTHLTLGANMRLINTRYPDKNIISFEKALTIRTIHDTPCIPLSQPGEGVYGHWLVDILPRVVFAKQLNQPLKYIISTRSPSYARSFLHLLGITDDDIVIYRPESEVVFMKNCYFPGHLRLESAFSPLAARLNTSMQPYFSTCKNRKLYISRGNFNKQQTIFNADALIKLVTHYGLEIIEPHKYTIKEQIKIFSEASLIMGEYGSAMHNTLFCYPNTSVIVLQSDAVPHFIQAGIGALLSQPTGFIFGEHIKNETRSFNAPLHLITQALNMLIN